MGKEQVFHGGSVFMLLATTVSFICDYMTATSLSWSLIVALSLVVSWFIFFVVTTSRQPVRNSLLAVTVAVVPYLWLLSIIIDEPLVRTIGVQIALVSLISLWGSYISFVRLHDRKMIALGLSLLMTIPLVSIITAIVHVEQTLYHLVNPLVLAFICFTIDYRRQMKR